jgi:hypothetical protein
MRIHEKCAFDGPNEKMKCALIPSSLSIPICSWVEYERWDLILWQSSICRILVMVVLGEESWLGIIPGSDHARIGRAKPAQVWPCSVIEMGEEITDRAFLLHER